MELAVLGEGARAEGGLAVPLGLRKGIAIGLGLFTMLIGWPSGTGCTRRTSGRWKSC
ncbi:hypothetical protein [Streptomyces avidinii]|uniref:Uncharacterized protein n=1 Tax=Streptomyces avidinii TaxID=1895 RepID=A0ABS4LDY6_STRAV|nr:hypothetical protein [Streptomyces avidinii]MBP2040318.1 hypothetical protein [Streptomyces avidinii]GGZ26624.1 hypothetical protein GCM10010343_62370 [Streptomyces avidinii]